MPISRDAYRTNLLDKRPALFSLLDGNPKQCHVKSQQIPHRDEQSIPQIRAARRRAEEQTEVHARHPCL